MQYIAQQKVVIVTALIVLGYFLSTEGQRALGFHQKYLYLCSEDERVLRVRKDMRVSNY